MDTIVSPSCSAMCPDELGFDVLGITGTLPFGIFSEPLRETTGMPELEKFPTPNDIMGSTFGQGISFRKFLHNQLSRSTCGVLSFKGSP